MKKRKNKSMLDLINEKRNVWTINPKTRVKGNELKDNKKCRIKNKKMVKDYLGDQKPSFLIGYYFLITP